MTARFAVGVDLGGTNLRVAVVIAEGELLEKVTPGQVANLHSGVTSFGTLPVRSRNPMGAVPAEIYRECQVAGDDPSDVFDKVLGGASATPFWQSVVPVARFENRNLTSLQLYPVTLNSNLSRPTRKTPERAKGDDASQIIAAIARLSEPLRTTIRFERGVGTVLV